MVSEQQNTPDEALLLSHVSSQPKLHIPFSLIPAQANHWVPEPPDMPSQAVMASIDTTTHLSFSLNSQVYRFKHEQKAYKSSATQHEFDLLTAAGESIAVKVHGCSLWKDKTRNHTDQRIIMALETQFDPKSVPRSQRRARMDQIISLIRALHTKGHYTRGHQAG